MKEMEGARAIESSPRSLSNHLRKEIGLSHSLSERRAFRGRLPRKEPISGLRALESVRRVRFRNAVSPYQSNRYIVRF